MTTFYRHLAALVLCALFAGFAACERLSEEVKQEKAAVGAGPAAGEEEILPAQTDEAGVILGALRSELDRSRRELRKPGYPAAYFLAYRLRDEAYYQLSGRYGAILEDNLDRKRAVYAEVRVGDYDFDNRGGQWDYQDYAPVWEGFDIYASLETVPGPLRRTFWLLSDAAYKGAIESYLRRRAETVQKAEIKKTPSFAKAVPQKKPGALQPLRLDRETWRGRLKRLSAILASSPDVIDSKVEFYAIRSDRFFVTSEGSEIVDGRVNFSLSYRAFGRAPDGEPLSNARVWVAPTAAGLPSLETLEAEAREVVSELEALRKSQPLPPYSGPALFAPDATGVFFHEAVGHRLEGERQEDEHSGQTFRDKVGQEIIPPFLTVVDDPTAKREGETPLVGHYEIDDEGVPSQSVTLVEKGVLKNFLLSRAPIENFAKSNGHGRSDAYRAPMARMGSLIVRSSNTVSQEELFTRLREETRRQGRSFGLYIEDVDSGETNTSRYGVQAFRGVPRRVWKVDAATGEKTLVRGVEMIGTPLASIRKILVTGDDYKVFNGFCGAESGMVPVSAVAPSALISEIETQRPTEPPRAPPILAPPPLPPVPAAKVVPAGEAP
ncbi:MAG: TldD/PmbA family protein [Bdellovibrionota bacterium]